MASTEFWAGFKKQGSLAVIGASAGMGIGGVLANRENQKVLDEFRGTKGKDAKTLFEGMRKELPKGTVLITRSDLHKLIDKEKSSNKAQILQGLRNGLELGNAMALHPDMISRFMKGFIPDSIKDKKIIFSSDKVHPSIFAHEAGHIIDFDEKRGPFKKFYKDYIRGTLAMEQAAWEKAPGKNHDEIKEKAISTYKRARNYPIIGALAGGIMGIAGDVALRKGL